MEIEQKYNSFNKYYFLYKIVKCNKYFYSKKNYLFCKEYLLNSKNWFSNYI